MSNTTSIPVTDYLKRPYSRLMVPETDGTFRGEILEFPGCIATGDTPSEALSALEEAATSWLEAALDRGQPIPDPVDNAGYSGRLVLRLPRSLHKKATRLAQRDGVSLNQFIIAGLAEHVGEHMRQENAAVINFLVSTPFVQPGYLRTVSENDARPPFVMAYRATSGVVTSSSSGFQQIPAPAADQWQTLPNTP
jgi:predicted RNase H-like HicB family nuclease